MVFLEGSRYFSGGACCFPASTTFFHFFSFPSAEQQHLKGLPEGSVAEGIANGADSAIDIADNLAAQVPQGDFGHTCRRR